VNRGQRVSFRFHRDGGFHGYFRDVQAKLEISDSRLTEELDVDQAQLVDWRSGHVAYPRLPDAVGRLLILLECGLADLVDVTGSRDPAERWQLLEAEETRLLAANADYRPIETDW
jgi:hypothetical protein